MSVFVGRSQELARLGQSLDRAAGGHGGIVLIRGEAGAGKSTLVGQFLRGATMRLPDLRILTGECAEHYGAGEPYQPFVDAFRALVHASEQASAPGRPRLRDLARQVAPHWLQVIPVAGDVIAAAAQTATEIRKTWGGGGGVATAPSEEALFFQYTELVLAAAQQQPILLFIDDLHWADQASVSLLAHLGRKILDQRVLILGTYRETDVAVADHPLRKAKLDLERYEVATEIALAPLDATSLGDLVRAELGAPAEPELLRWLVLRAGATPLFFGELLRWLVAQGLVREADGEWVLVRIPDDIEIPRTAEAIIEKRLTRLDPDHYKIVEYASVFGEVVRLVRRMGASGRLVHPLHNLAELLQESGDLVAAEAKWRELLAAARETGQPDPEIIARAGLALNLLEQGDMAGAAAELDGAAAQLGPREAWSEGREAWHMAAARLAIARGDRTTAVQLLTEAEQVLAGGDPYVLAQFQIVKAEVLSDEDPSAAANAAEAALSTLARLGAEPMRQRAEQLLARTAR